MNAKPRVLKDYDKLPDDLKEQIKLKYPTGYIDFLVRYTDREGKLISALPFETSDKYYMVKMTQHEAQRIVDEDDDFDDDGMLKDSAKESYEGKYSDDEEEEDDDTVGYGDTVADVADESDEDA